MFRKLFFFRLVYRCFFPSELEEEARQQPPVHGCSPSTKVFKIHFNKLRFSFLQLHPAFASSFTCTSSFLNQSFHSSYIWTCDAIILVLWLHRRQLDASRLTLYGSCGWRRVSDFPCLSRLTSCSPRSGLRRTSPHSERLQTKHRENCS